MPESSEGVLSETFPITAASTDEMESVVRQHSRFVYAIAYSVLRNHHDAEDAAQETFVRFWRHRRRWRLIRNPRAWLARTAWRVALDARKKRHAQDDSSVSLSESVEAISQLRAAGMPADEIAARGEMTALLDRLIDSLPEELRNPLALSLVEELTSPEIAAILGIPEGSVRQRMWQARQILKEKLSVLLEGKHGR
ncbi:MAG: sigma-70 family RNA polymerase sigma factor [Terriglobia bacterium]|jgi:RNA polymerase sigma-70 factor (ECF subfamily)